MERIKIADVYKTINRNLESQGKKKIGKEKVINYIKKHYDMKISEKHPWLSGIPMEVAKEVAEAFEAKLVSIMYDFRKHLYLKFPSAGVRLVPKFLKNEGKGIIRMATSFFGTMDLAAYEKEMPSNYKMEDYAEYLKENLGAIEINGEEFMNISIEGKVPHKKIDIPTVY